ncbi:molybdopterin molybdochelatase [Brevibacterium sanguinis]|uniref:Molybdopterin molybdenumtransferase n=2 Tax=Brevibacterium TaxID=1696 RepID=A0A366II66_9MICO|nr:MULTISPECIES: molybdopterin molybdotransferase MoeA [Brevibacterium]RBP64192.1 molybdopterin molybdochelatase [Brevibacterium sanguinis]RBP71516.1 molybdopterin molybdochelatase [Brevibacterium celere]
MTQPIMHRRRVSELISPLGGTETLELTRLLDRPRRLTADVRSPIDVPGFDNSSMDGYALSASTAGTGGPIPVRGRVAAGAVGTEVEEGTAVEIMTGAPLPPGTDLVVPVEATRPGRFDAPEITLLRPATAGDFVRRRGSDVTAGTRVLEAGAMLSPARLGVAAACGVDRLEVLRLPRVLLVSTGDEIAAAPGDGPEASARIHDANAITLAAHLHRLGASVETLSVPDDPQALLEQVSASDADLVVSTGGVSKGAHEVVKLAADLDPTAAMDFTVVAMQPGGPQGCGTLAGHPWVALPGNPVSALISFEMFLRPALLRLDVDEDPRPVEHHRLPGGLDEAPPSGKLQIRRAVLAGSGLELVGGSRSHLLHSYARSTHLVFIPPCDDGPDAPGGRDSAPGTDRADENVVLKTWRIS